MQLSAITRRDGVVSVLASRILDGQFDHAYEVGYTQPTMCLGMVFY